MVRECAAIENMVVFDADGLTAANALSLAELEARGRALEIERPELSAELAHAAGPEDLATIIYTSGTTGEPKGVMLTHANMVSNLIDSSKHLAFGERDSALSVLPLSHIFERQAMNMYLHHGMSVYFGEALEKIGANLCEVHPTAFVGVPRIFEKILARVQERALAKGKLNGALCNWAIEIGKQWAQLKARSQPIPLWLSLAAQARRRAGVCEVAQSDGRSHSDFRIRRSVAIKRRGALFPGRRHVDRARLWVDRNVAGDHGRPARGQSYRHSRETDTKCRSADCV